VSTDLRLVGAAVGCWLTALACLFCPAWAGWATGLGALALAVLWSRLPVRVLRPMGWVVVAALLGVACGAVATAARVGERDAEPLAGLAAGYRTVQVGLRISDDPVLAENLIWAVQAACLYSWRMPPSRSCRRTRSLVIWSGSAIGVGSGCSGRALARP
jgi:hypothetical protein